MEDLAFIHLALVEEANPQRDEPPVYDYSGSDCDPSTEVEPEVEDDYDRPDIYPTLYF